jgi:hypothetical protein
LAGGLVFGCAGALAALRYPLLGQISGTSTPSGSFQGIEGVAVDGASGSVLVSEIHLVQVFASAGGYEATWNGSNTPAGSFHTRGVAANDSTGDVYVADDEHGVVDVFSSAGGYLSQITGAGVPGGLGSPIAVAVAQSSGEVFVSDRSSRVIDVFSSAGVYLSQITSAGGQTLGEDFGMTVDGATGDLLVADRHAGVVHVFDAATGAFVTTWTGSNTPQGSFGGSQGHEVRVAANDSSGDVYIADRAHKVVDQFTPAGAYVNQIQGTPTSPFGEVAGVAVGQASGEVYVPDRGGSGVVDIFGANAVILPDVSTGVASAVQPTGVTLNGTVNPAGVQVSDCHFLYGSSEAYGQSVPCVQSPAAIGAGSAPVAVSASVAGLVPGTVYHFRLFAGNANGENEGQDAIFGPPRVDGTSASGETKTTATLEAQVNPDGVDSTYHFEYGTTSAYGTSAPVPDGALGAGASDQAASVEVKELRAGVTYHYRVVAVNAAGRSAGPDATFTTVPPARIDGVTISGVSASSAMIHALINPLGTDTTYHLEYGPSTGYGASIPTPDADIGSGSGDQAVTQQLNGLAANTTYHVRVVAVNALGSVTGADHTFVYDTSGGGLPDNRAYEMVTPPQKNAALFGPYGEPFFYPSIAGDGSRVVLDSIQCFAGAASCTGNRLVQGEPYSFTRGAGGWVTTPLAPPASQFGENSAWLANADAGTALFTVATPPMGEDDFYARQPDGSFLRVGPATAPALGPLGPVEAGLQFGVVTTADLSHVVYSLSKFWPFDASIRGAFYSLYEYAGSGSAVPELVGVSGGPGSTDLISVCTTTLGGNGVRVYNAMSGDGGTVFFTATKCASGSGVNAGIAVPAETLYARVGGSRSVLVSGRSPGDCTAASGCLGSPAGDALFEGASVDGSKAFFTDTQRLTDSASQDANSGDGPFHGEGCSGTTGTNGCNLYEYDFANPVGHSLLAVSAGDTSGGGPRVQDVMAISSDGSHVYFVAKGVLSGAANGQGLVARAGAENLYVFERDASYPQGRVSFIAVLPEADKAQWSEGIGGSLNVTNVTPDGRFLVFVSHGSLTPDDTSVTGAAQVFRYDAQTGGLVRVSTGERGFNDNGNAGAGNASIVGLPTSQNFHTSPVRSDPSMSDDGSFVFFESPVGLTPGALNEAQTGSGGVAENVYEWHEGRVSLISDGRDTSEWFGRSSVRLLGSDASGANVFFSTADRLVGQDTDTELDYYDARVCTASDPCVSSPSAPAACEGEACRGAPPAEASLLAAGSASFSGPGNRVAPAGKPAVKPRKKAKHRKGKPRRRKAKGKSRRVRTGKRVKRGGK